MKAKRKLGLTLSLWVLILAWTIRHARFLSGSVIPTSFGSNIDYTRHRIVQTGHITPIEEPITLISSFAGSQNYDIGSIFLASINILTGTTDLVPALTFLHLLQLQALMLLVVVLAWYVTYRRTFDLRERWYAVPVLVALTSFTTYANILRYGSALSPDTLAFLVTLVLLLLLLAPGDRRRLAAFVVLAGALSMMYHTVVFLGLLVVTAALVGLRVLPTGGVRPSTSRVFTTVVAVFLLIGMFHNNRYEELVTNLAGVVPFLGGGSTGAQLRAAAGSELVQSTASAFLSELTPGRVLRIANRLFALLLVALFLGRRLLDVVTGSGGSPLERPHDRVLLSAIGVFPFILVMFYAWGGVAAAIERTQYIGIYVVMFAGGMLLLSDRDWTRYAAVALAVLVVTTAVSGAVVDLKGPPHRAEGGAAIRHTGQAVPDVSYTFSHGTLGPPLMYYNQKGITVIKPDVRDWRRHVENVYFDDETGPALRSIRSVNRQQTIREIDVERVPSYVLMDGRVENSGVPMLAIATAPTQSDPRPKFDRSPEMQRVYTTGEITLYERT